MFALIPSKEAGMFDFMLQAVFKPAFLQAEQAAKIEAMFNEGQIPCLTMG